MTAPNAIAPGAIASGTNASGTTRSGSTPSGSTPLGDTAPGGAAAPGSAAQARATLSRGVNITNWFRYPATSDPARLAAYLSDAALGGLRSAGFDFVRLAVDPNLAALRPAVVQAVRRIQNAGLATVICPHAQAWHLEDDPTPLPQFWRQMAPLLRDLDPLRTVPEVMNEPVFPGNAPAWSALQYSVLTAIRAALPHATVVLTGADWGSVGGLLALRPVADPNVVYSFHFYDPSELTSLAAWLPGADRTAFARLPFPVTDPTACRTIASNAASAGTVAAYCATGWDAARVREPIARAAAWGAAYGVRLLAGEFGASIDLNRTSRLAWFSAVRSALTQYGIGWALWGYEDSMGFALPRPPPARPVLDPDLLRALGMVRA